MLPPSNTSGPSNFYCCRATSRCVHVCTRHTHLQLHPHPPPVTSSMTKTKMIVLGAWVKKSTRWLEVHTTTCLTGKVSQDKNMLHTVIY